MDSAYLTNERFKLMGMGVDLTNVSDFELESHLGAASALVDSHCDVPMLPLPHSFLGGTVVGEEARWRFPKSDVDPGTRRVYLKHRPIISLQAFSIVVGMASQAPLPINDLIINNKEGWIEVTALTISNALGLFGVTGWIVPIGGLKEPMALVDYTYGWNLPVVNERARQIAEGSPTYQTGYGFWTDDPVVVTAGGTTYSVDQDYELDPEEGRVMFKIAPPDLPVRVSYHHKLMREVPLATADVAAYLIGEANLRRKGLQGLSSIKVNEIAIQRPRRMSGDTGGVDVIDEFCPVAKKYLEGLRYWSIG
jgi:hypothetical protein